MSLLASDFNFPKSHRLLKRRDFQRLAHNSKRVHGKFVTMDIKSSKGDLSRLGVTASRHFGKSHVRNRFKRLVRESFRLCYHLFPHHFDINVKPRPEAKNATLKNIMDDILYALK